MTATSRVSFQTGCWHPARSMMLSRRMPSASPGARVSPIRNPSSSGPRCRIAAAMARTRNSASLLRDANATPQIPHTLLLDLRSRKEGYTSAQGVLAQVETGDSQVAVGVPCKNCAHQQEEEHCRHAQHQIKKRLSLQEQAPIDSFLPARSDCAQQLPQPKSNVRQPRQADMGKVIVAVLTRIIRDDAGGLFENCRILQILARQMVARGIPHDDAIRRIDDDPPVAYQDFGYDVLRIVIGSQEKQPARPQIGTSHQIQERIVRGPADVQEMPVSECHLRIALRKCVRTCRNGPRWLDAHPVQNSFELFFFGQP